MLTEFEQQVIKDALEGWEFVDFLQVSIEEVIQAALEFDWVTEENRQDLLEFVGVK